MSAEIDEQTVARVAAAAKLTLTDEERATLARDLQDILAAFRVLDEVDVTGVRSSFRPFEEHNTLREDIAHTPVSREEALRSTKQHQDGFFIGPRTID